MSQPESWGSLVQRVCFNRACRSSSVDCGMSMVNDLGGVLVIRDAPGWFLCWPHAYLSLPPEGCLVSRRQLFGFAQTGDLGGGLPYQALQGFRQVWLIHIASLKYSILDSGTSL